MRGPDGVHHRAGQLHPRCAQQDDRVHPQVPHRQKRDPPVEPQLGPLVQSALQRKAAAQVHHHRRLGQVEQRHRRQPEDNLRLPQLGGSLPTQLSPTTYRIWVSTRSVSPSSLRRPALCCSTRDSAGSDTGEIVARARAGRKGEGWSPRLRAEPSPRILNGVHAPWYLAHPPL